MGTRILVEEEEGCKLAITSTQSELEKRKQVYTLLLQLALNGPFEVRSEDYVKYSKLRGGVYSFEGIIRYATTKIV